MIKKALGATILFTLLSSAANSTPIIFHEGGSNPVDEGWRNSGFASAGPSTENGSDSWSIEKQLGYEYRSYSYTIDSDDLTLAKQLGWSYSFEVQYTDFLSPTSNGLFFQINTNGKVWDGRIGGQADLDQVFSLGYGGPLSYVHEGSGQSFHNYEFRYDPFDELVDVYINNLLTFENIDGGSSSRPDGTGTISWGISPSSAIGKGDWRWVDFSINESEPVAVPEPGSLVLLIAGILSLGVIRRIRSESK
jgi:hypothetical protein